MNVETAINKVKGHIDRLFDKNLTDLIRGIRNNRENEAKYISQCIDEIKMELKQENMAIKANAVAKLSYLQMIGYNINWAAFNIIEVMSSTKFTYKRIGYLAASQSFHPQTDVLMLTTNMIKKDINSSNQYEAAISLGGLACFITPDLARDLSNDITSLMSSTKPYLRKRAILMMYKIFVNYPDALEHGFTKMKDKLEDQDQSVQSAAVNVICELARRNPKNYLSLAPIFFKLMTNSTNNWMLIKIIKLFGTLTPLEPRLGKKLMEPLTNLIHSTSAMSLLYECINTLLAVLVSISSGQPDHSSSVQLCLQKLRILIEDSDQNLKYLGLLAMGKILKTYPKNVQAHKDIVLRCLEDKDDSIRLRALHLLYGMVNKKNLVDIVKTLLNHLCTSDCPQGYRDELMTNLVNVCSQNNYQFVTDFEWYLGVLIEMSKLDTPKNGELIASQLLDVTIRVPTLRPFSVHQMENLLDNSHLFSFKGQNRGMSEVLYVAAYLCGEFSEFLKNPELTLQNLLEPRVLALPANVQSVFIINSLKVYARLLGRWLKKPSSGQSILSQDYEIPLDTGAMVVEKLRPFCQSNHVEVQERASEAKQLVEFICKNKAECLSSQLLFQLFAGELRPVAPKAQKKVPVPIGLDLEEPINEKFNDATNATSSLASKTDSNQRTGDIFGLSASGTTMTQRYQLDDDYLNSDTSDASTPPDLSTKGGSSVKVKKTSSRRVKDEQKNEEPTKEELERARLARIEERAHNPHYLKSAPGKAHKKHANHKEGKGRAEAFVNVSDIPVQKLELDLPLRTNENGSGDFEHDNFPHTPVVKDDEIEHRNGDIFDLNHDVVTTTRRPVSSHVVQILEPEMPDDALSSSPAQSDHESRVLTGSTNSKKKNRQEDKTVANKQIVMPSKTAVVGNDERKEMIKPKGDKERKKKKHKEHKHDSRTSGDVRHHKKHEGSVLLDHVDDVPNVQDNLLITTTDHDEGPQKDHFNSINGFEELKELTSKPISNGTNAELDDLDFWLSPSSQIPPVHPQTANSQDIINGDSSLQLETPEPKKHHKKSKHKSDGSKHKDHQKGREKGKDLSPPRSSKKHETVISSADAQQPNFSIPLAQNDHINLTYTTKAEMTNRQMLMTLFVTNVSPTCLLKNVELTILDSGLASLTMLRPPFILSSKNTFDSTDINKVLKTLSSTSTLVATTLERAEPISVGLLFGCESFAPTTMPQLRLRGCLSYLAKDSEKSTSEKLDFKTTLPTHAFMSPVPISNSEFEKLLVKNQNDDSLQALRYSRDFNLSLSDQNSDENIRVDEIIHILSSKFHFYVVERVGNSAVSMYSKTILDQPVCLLLKFRWPNSQVNVLGKSTSQELVNALLIQEMQPYLAKLLGTV